MCKLGVNLEDARSLKKERQRRLAPCSSRAEASSDSWSPLAKGKASLRPSEVSGKGPVDGWVVRLMVHEIS